MKINNIKNKIIASVLAFATAISSFAIIPQDVAAAGTYYVKFKNNLNGKEEIATTVLEGETIYTVKSVPESYNYQPTPFKALDTTDAIIKPTATDLGTGVLVLTGAVGDQSKIYNIGPQFSASLTKSDMSTVICNTKDTQTPTDDDKKTYGFTADIIDGRSVSIIQQSKLKLVVKSGTEGKDKPTSSGGPETPNGTQGTLEFLPIKESDATGDLAMYKNATPIYGGVKDGKFLITIPNGSDPLPLALTPSSPLPLMYQGSVFEVTFSLQTIAPMQLTVISRPKAVDEIATAIDTTTNLDKFVKFTSGDKQHTIANNFSLVCLYDDYNYKGFKVNWKWVPDDIASTKYVDILPPQPGASTQTVAVTPQLKSISGHLEATVLFDKDKTKPISSKIVAKIPITIMGTGIPPQLFPKFSYEGTNSGVPLNGVMPSEMDVNDDSFTGFPTKGKPYRFEGELQFGSGSQKARNAKIDVHYTMNGKAKILIGSSTTPYVSGTLIPVPNPDVATESSTSFKFYATHEGQVKITVAFLNDANTIFASKTYTVNISDSSPSKDATFKDIKLYGIPVEANSLGGTPEENTEQEKFYKDRFKVLFGAEGNIPIADFDIEKTEYNITVPFAVEKINLAPFKNSKFAKDVMVICGTKNWSLKGDGQQKLPVGEEIKLPTDGKVTQIFVNGTAQDNSGSSYTLNITRAPQSDIASLKTLEVMTYKDNKVQKLTPDFAPDIFNYAIELPYAFRGMPQASGAKVTAVSVGDWGETPKFESPTLKAKGLFASIFSNKNTTDWELKYEVTADGEIRSVNEIKVTVRSEDRKQSVTYIVRVTIKDPDENNLISQLQTFEKDGTTEVPYVGGQTFNKVGRDFYIDISFKTDKLWFSVLPDSEKSEKVKFVYPEVYWKTILGTTEKDKTMTYSQKGKPIRLAFDVPYKDDKAKETTDFIYQFDVQAEDEHWTSEVTETYKLHIHREAANKDASLASLDITDVTDNKPIEEFVFSAIKYDYDVSVPFTTEEVLVAPVTKSKLSLASVDGTQIKDGRLNKNVKLTAGAVTTILVEVIPESGTADKKIYTIKIKRQAPSTEARLKSLVVGGGENMLPNPFVPSNTTYSVEIPKGTLSYTITPTLADEKGSVTINKKLAKSGQASGPYNSLEATTVYEIAVTAQDAKTVLTYRLTVIDYNLTQKSDRSDLLAINPNYGDLKPNFKSNIDTYQVFLKPNAKQFEIKPSVSARAKLEVSIGSKVLLPIGGIYSTAVFNNKDTITLTVTPENGDETKVKTYKLNLIKNDKKEQGKFKPITADMVDYEADPILIDITNYAVVDASVFNKLKTEYPKKTIVFSGNDYMLKIKGEDLKELVPHETQYDLAFSFTTPDESIISNLINNSDNFYDWYTDPVYLYFDDHGPLPGQMLLTVSLGREYQNSQLYWNYFNDERERIDYYGYINSNAKGTITVPLTHLSTYMVTKKQLAISENKTAMGFGWIQNSVIPKPLDPSGEGETVENGNVTDDKHNPQTGVK